MIAIPEPRRVQNVLRLKVDDDLPVDRNVKLALRPFVAALRVTEGPGELLGIGVDVDRVRVGLLDVVENGPEVASQASTMMIGMIVQTISSFVLPWIGSPSLSSPGLAATDQGRSRGRRRRSRDKRRGRRW